MPFSYSRIVRFSETDAAGVVYFANVLNFCHEAYEASLVASGIDLKAFFSNPNTALPIVRANVDFRHPLHCGDRFSVLLSPQPQNGSEFDIYYQILINDRVVATASTSHVCIDPTERKRKTLSEQMFQWLDQWSEKKLP